MLCERKVKAMNHSCILWDISDAESIVDTGGSSSSGNFLYGVQWCGM